MAKTIRQAILEEMKGRNWTIYRLTKQLEGKVARRIVYQYLSEGRDTGTRTASAMLEMLGLKIATTNRKRGGRPRKEKSK